MSVNIIVNGKYTKSCLRHDLLNDPEQIKKEAENERRKMRIQQVRAVSKNMAKKVRNDVEMEKERQLKKIEEIKIQEMEMWRQNVLAQQQRDFRSAIFQVGTAHRAAKAENAKQAKRKPLEKCAPLSKEYRNVTISSKGDKENVHKNVNIQTDITGKCYPKPTAPRGYRNEFNASSKQTNDVTSELEDECDGENSTMVSTDLSSNVLQSSTTSFPDSDEIPKAITSKKIKSVTKLNKTTPVLMEVQAESDTSLIETPNIEDHHKQTNRHFSQMVSTKTPKKLNSKFSNKSLEPKPTDVSLSHPSTSAAAKKRFTQISDIIRQQKSSDEIEGQPMEASYQFVAAGRSPTKSKSRPLIDAAIQSENSRMQRSPTKSTFKSPTAYRPVSTQTAGTLASKSSSSIQSQRSNTARVQFYDYNNKFQKQYEQPASAVEIHDPIADRLQMNAMQQAELGDKLRDAREFEMEKLRQKSAERCQKAIEKEQVRRACEDLTAKLDALTNQRQALPSDNYQFSSFRLGQVAAEKETKLNNAVEDILRRPAVITCPVVNHQQSHRATLSHGAPRHNDNDLNLGSAFERDDINNLNSSDSCCSILLGYVNGQSKQIADDIKKFNNHNGETDKAKAEKLQNLLTRINRLREGLISELDKCSTSSTTNRERVQTMMDSISEFRKERENILVDSNSKDSLSKRENNLMKKEAILEKKLREFYEIQKAAKKRDNVINSDRHKEKVGEENFDNVGGRSKNTCNGSGGESEREDIQRVAEKQDKTKREGQVRSKEKEKEDDSFSSQEVAEEEFVERRKLLVGQNPLEIIIKVKGDTKAKKYKKIASKSPRKLCTLIQSPAPKKIRKKLPVQSNESSSTSYRSLPPTIHNNVDKLLKIVPKSVNQPTTAADIQPRQEDKKKQQKQISNLNPLLTHYVQRLLGMSRTSINALGVSSSDVDTPSSSIVNASANLSAAESERLTSNRLEHVQKFIEDNYSFIGELEESIRQSNSADSSSKTIEVIWKKALKEQNQKKIQHALQSVKPTKSALKKPSAKQPSEVKQQQTALVDKSTQLTDNCTQRIAELTELIRKVRQEKQKILETTLSSGSENGPNSTEYLDLPDRRNNSETSTSRILDSQLVKSVEHLPMKSPETAPQLEKNKSIGISRDSGISESRPITVQESRDSPTEDLHQAQSSTDPLSYKKPKPPISIARYSPQLVEDIPHELSTIFEVDTPATSRVNTSIRANNGQELTGHQLRDERAENIIYKKFSTFEEYVQLNKLDMSQFDPEFSMLLEKEFTEFINQVKEENGSGHSQFTLFSKYFANSSSDDDRGLAEELLASLKIANLSYKKFPTTKEYLDKLGISTSDLLDSRSLDKSESSTESLMNIEEELKLRKILTRSFGQNGQANYKGSSSSFPSAATHNFLDTKMQQTDISGIRQMTTSTDDQTDNLEDGLKRLGMRWPSAMKKKIMETQALSSSTSSSLGPVVFTPKRKQLKQPVEKSSQEEAYETTSQTEDGGRQLNLREFLTKEFLKLTTTSASVSYSDDSIASSILRSIIGSMMSSPHQQENVAGLGLDRQKTSTPMASQSTGKEASRSQGGASSVQLFSGESRLSSVHFNNSSRGGTNQNTGKKIDTESENML